MQAGFLIYLPVYRGGQDWGAVAERRRQIVGWVFSPLRMNDLIEGIFGKQVKELSFEIYDGETIAPDALMYASQSGARFQDSPYGFSSIRQINAMGHTWSLRIRSIPGTHSKADINQPTWVWQVGTIISLLFTMLAWALASSSRRAYMYAKQMNSALIDSEQKLNSILDSSEVAIAWANEQGQIEYVNDSFVTLFGYTLEDVPTVEQWYRHAYPDPAYRSRAVAEWEQKVANSLPQKDPIERMEVRVRCKDGKTRHVILMGSWAGNKLLANFSDISWRKEAEEKLAQQLLFAGMLNKISELIVKSGDEIQILSEVVRGVAEVLHVDRAMIYDISFDKNEVKGLTEWINPAHSNIASMLATYPLDNIIHSANEMRHTQHWLSSDRDAINPVLQRDSAGSVLHQQMDIQSLMWFPFLFHEDGYYLLALSFIYSSKKWSGLELDFLQSVSHLVCIEIEKLELLESRKQREVELLQYKSIIDSTEDAVISKSLDGIIKSWNLSAERIFGYKSEEAIGAPINILIPPEWQAFEISIMQKIIRGEHVHAYETVRQRKDGQLIHISATMDPIYDGQGGIIGISNIARDISERKNAELALKLESEKNLALLQNASDGIHILDHKGYLLEASNSFMAMLGYQAEELIGQHVSCWDAQMSAAELDQAIEAQFQSSQPSMFETRHRCKDGRIIDVEISGLPLILNGHPVLFNSSRDISKRKQSEQQVNSLMVEQAAMLETSLAGIAKVKDRIFIWVNPAMEKIFGYDKGELNGVSTRVIYVDDLAYQELGKSAYPLLALGGIYRFQSQFRRKDGSRIWIDMNGIMLDPQQGVSFWTFNDISESKQAELEMLAAKQASESLAQSKSEFLANMSHEIRTPMNAIIGLSRLALDQEMPEAIRNYLVNINTSSENLLGILNDILDFSKIEAGKLNIELEELDIVALMDELYELFMVRAQEKNIGFATKIEADVPQLLIGDTLRIKQVLSNLLGNAIKFTEHGKVGVQVQLLAREDSNAIILFSVSDTGIGMSVEDQSRLFQPFSQADTSITRRYGGTGLGLAISQRLLQLMGSTFTVDSTPALGTTFSFELSLTVAAGELHRANEHKPIERTMGALSESLSKQGETLRGRRILVAEDSRLNQQVVTEFLKLSGASVDIANNGKEALELLAQTEYDAVLMDVHMPEMGGVEATENIRQQAQYANLPVIALTAGVTQEERKRCKACGMNDFVAKPINPQELVKILVHWIDKNQGQAEGLPLAIPTNHLVASPAKSRLEKLPGFDLKNVLEMVGGDTGMVEELLLDFCDEIDTIKAEADALISALNLPEAAKLMHRIKGTAGNLGASELHAIAAEMEMSLKRNEFNVASHGKFVEVLQRTQAVLSKLKQ